jgi:hypothetical protein
MAELHAVSSGDYSKVNPEKKNVGLQKETTGRFRDSIYENFFL